MLARLQKLQCIRPAASPVIKSMSSLDVLLVMRACTEQYPPTLNQGNLLASYGLPVGLLDLSHSAVSSTVNPVVRRWQPDSVWNSKTEPPRSFVTRCRNFLRFQQAYRRIISEESPKAVLAYDILGAAIVPPRQRAYRTIYHFHELPEREPGMRVGTRLSLAKARRRSRDADLIVFSDANRAACYKETAQLRTQPFVVMNCPMRVDTVPVSPLRALLQERGLADRKVVCYVGSIGLDKGIIEAVSSMRHWPEQSLLVLVGACSETVKERIFGAAKEVGAAEHVIFLGQKPHPEAMALAAGSDVGLALIQPTTRNWHFSAGAINKRFEYMSVGLPQVTNSGPGVSEIVEKTGCGICVDPNSPEAIGQAVRRLLEFADLRLQMAENSRRIHLAEFHYERQFEPVLQWIEKAVKKVAA